MEIKYSDQQSTQFNHARVFCEALDSNRNRMLRGEQINVLLFAILTRNINCCLYTPYFIVEFK